MKTFIKKLLRENLLSEKLLLKNWDQYIELVANT